MLTHLLGCDLVAKVFVDQVAGLGVGEVEAGRQHRHAQHQPAQRLSLTRHLVTAALVHWAVFLLGTCYNASKLTLQFVYVNFYVTKENWTIIETLQRNISGPQSWCCNTLNKVLVVYIESWGSEECGRQRLLPTRVCGGQSDCAGSTELRSAPLLWFQRGPSPAQHQAAAAKTPAKTRQLLHWPDCLSPHHHAVTCPMYGGIQLSTKFRSHIHRKNSEKAPNGTYLQLLALAPYWNCLLKLHNTLTNGCLKKYLHLKMGQLFRKIFIDRRQCPNSGPSPNIVPAKFRRHLYRRHITCQCPALGRDGWR